MTVSHEKDLKDPKNCVNETFMLISYLLLQVDIQLVTVAGYLC